jgi:hypothetical protein
MKALLILCLFLSPIILLGQLHVLPAQGEYIYTSSRDYSQSKIRGVSDTLSLHRIKAITQLHICDGNNLNVAGKYWIEHFEMIVTENSRTGSYKSSSEKLTDKMRSRLTRIKPYAKISFEFIRIIMPDGTIRSVHPLNYFVVQNDK